MVLAFISATKIFAIASCVVWNGGVSRARPIFSSDVLTFACAKSVKEIDDDCGLNL